jgi:hypothetical protein
VTIPKGRFVVFDKIYGIHRGVVIADFAWWIAVEDEVREWCLNNNIRTQQQGMVIQFDDDESFTMFILRWS